MYNMARDLHGNIRQGMQSMTLPSQNSVQYEVRKLAFRAYQNSLHSQPEANRRLADRRQISIQVKLRIGIAMIGSCSCASA